jgi:hypothetical protein
MKNNKMWQFCHMAGDVVGETPEQVFAEQRFLPYGGIERASIILKYDEGPIGVIARAVFPCLEIIDDIN